MLNCGWSESVLRRNAQPVLMVVSCLCLCLGSCFPSSEPLNRITSLRRRSATYTEPHRTMAPSAVEVTTARPPQNVFISSTPSYSNMGDPYFRNMDTVLKSRLDSSGQLSSNVIPQAQAGPISSVNSTGRGGNVNSSISSALADDNSLTNPRRSRHRQRPATLPDTASVSQERTQQTRRTNRKQKKRERLSQNGDTMRPSRTSTRRRLEPSARRTGGGAGKRRNNVGSGSGLESRSAAFPAAQLSGSSFCQRITGPRWRDVRQLSNTRSWTLAVYPDGTVAGTRDQNSINTFLVFVSYRRSFVRIYAEAADKYVCMDNVTGNVYATEVASKYHCIFRERSNERSWTNTYSLINREERDASNEEPLWYLGISKKGEVKSGRRVRQHQLIAQFVLMSPSFPEETCPGGNPDI